MFRKEYFVVLFAGLLLLIGNASAVAQTAPIRGRVELKKADATVEPVAGATVELIRADIKSKAIVAKTDKKGDFSFVGATPGGEYIVSVSGTGIGPNYIPYVKAGTENVVVTVVPGDGRYLSADQVRAEFEKAAAGGGETGELTPEQQKKKAEYEKQKADIEAKNAKIENSNAIINKSLAEGIKLFNDKNYDAALISFQQGFDANPTYIGSAPVMLNNKAIVLRKRGAETYNKGVLSKDPAEGKTLIANARKDILDSIATYQQSLAVLKTLSPTAEAADKEGATKATYTALSGLVEDYGLAVSARAGIPNPTEATDAFVAYIAVEPDAVRKTKAQVTLGDVMLDAGENDKALAAYKVVLDSEPENPDALIGAGFALTNIGYLNNNDKEKFQEAVNYLQKFLSVAPATHKMKDDAAALIDTFKSEQKVVPQKGGGKKGKN